MDKRIQFDYYYGIEAEQFSFYRVPRLLIKDVRFKGLSSDAKLLYGLMLDRMSLSMKNGWFDSENRAYIIYTVDNIAADLGCSKPTCTKIMRELDSDNGIGLIEKKRRGLGKPDIIYVKNFTVMEEKESVSTDASTEEKMFNFQKEKNLTSGNKESESQEVKDFEFQKQKNFTSGSKGSDDQEVKGFEFQKQKNFTSGSKRTEPQEVKGFAPNYTNYNHINQNNTDFNYINQSDSELKQGVDVMEDIHVYMEIIKENIEYEHHMKYDRGQAKELYEELFEVICEIVCVKRKTVKVGGIDYPYELVKSKFLKLRSSHLEYVMNCMQETTTKIANIKSYMITALFNASSTISHYYQQEMQHDMYGSC